MTGNTIRLVLSATAAGWLAAGAGAATIQVVNLTPDLGTAVVEPDQDDYEIGTLVTFRGEPVEGYHVAEWYGPFVSSADTITVPVEGDMEVIVAFAPLPYYVLTPVTDPSGAGSIVFDPPAVEHQEGTQVTLYAVAGPGYAFDHWDGDVVDNVGSNGITITVAQDMDVVAVFEPAATVDDDTSSRGSVRVTGPCGAISVANLALLLTALASLRRLR